MLFSSTVFLFGFLPVLLLLHLALRSLAARNALLLVASLCFYAWGETGWVLLLLVCAVQSYCFGLWIERRRESRLPVSLAVASNLALLVGFKYANFLVDNLRPLLAPLGLALPELAPLHLPIGISFFTFQAITYVVDLRRGDAPLQRNPLRVALYVSLFPQLIAGPIVRYRQVAHQLAERRATREDVAAGARRFVVGLGKKVLLANTLAVPADRIFALPPGELPAAVAWLGALCYGLQIYFDFSGYTDMAIGLGRIFGFRFPENFRHPYVSRSIREFWRRWHMTLSSWFRDYVYIPLGGSRHGAARTTANLLLVFVLCGFWHGASWTFLVWGLLHGAFLVAERAGGERILARLPAGIRVAYTLLVVSFAWVVFRADTLAQALGYWAAMLTPSGDGSPHTIALFLDARVALALAVGVLGATPWLPVLEDRLARKAARAGESSLARLEWAWSSARWLVCNALLAACAMSLVSGTHNPFIYFRF